MAGLAGKVGGLLRLTRIEHSVMLIIAVVAAELLVGGIPPLPVLLLSLVAPAFVSMSAFAINDYFDVEADRRNKRLKRPIVAGVISKNGALLTALVCAAVGILAALPINAYDFWIAVIFAALGFLYSYRLKDIALVGNVYVAFSMVIPFIFGNFVVSNMVSPVIVLISIMIFLSGLAREIHGMIRDKEGDSKARGSRNIVSIIGAAKSAYFAFLLYLEAITVSVFLLLYYAPFKNNVIYIIPFVIVDLMFIYVAYGAVAHPTRKFFDIARNVSLGAMLLALLALLFSALFYVAV